MSKQAESWPAPMRTESSEAGAALRQYEHDHVEAPSEPAAYSRVMTALQRSPSRRRLFALGTAALAVPVLLWLVHARNQPVRHAAHFAQSQARPIAKVEPPTSTQVELAFRLGPAPKSLPTGKLVIEGGVSAELSTDASATGRLQDGTLDIALSSGTIALQVSPRPVGQAVLISADAFRFTVVGTVFSLSRKAHRLDLTVQEGLVAISRDGDHQATVASGEDWSMRLPPPALQRKDITPRIARGVSVHECKARLAGKPKQEQLACFREKARKGGADGERAQHALARYLRDDMADLDAALAAFEAQRSRYPRGELRTEADRAIIELLPRLGRHAEALVETQSYLDAKPDADDRAEIRLLRGDIYRAIFQDLLSAEREYDESAEAAGRTGDDGRFLRALCLEALGRLDEARLAYQDYLAQNGTAHASEAKRRMERLAR
jgi:ferric-dicitrate binding protein FerR (iron transport regulator)